MKPNIGTPARSRHSGESRNPLGFVNRERLDSGLRRNDGKQHLESGGIQGLKLDYRRARKFTHVQGLALVPLVFLILAIIPACEQKKQPPPPPPPEVTVAQPLQRQVTDSLDVTGNTQAVRTVQLRARVSGFLEKILFQDGQVVKEGELLFVIQQNTYRANLEQAEAAILQQKTQIEYATTELERFSELLKQNAAAQTDVDNWRFQRDSGKANLINLVARRDLARLDLSYTEIRAPFNGRIDRRLVDPGNLVGSGEITTLAEISQTDPIYTYFTISDSDLARIMESGRWRALHPGTEVMPVFMGVFNENGNPHEGRLDFASISVNPTTGTLLLRGVFPNPDGRILPGLYARVRLPLREKTALLVPLEAVGSDQRGSYVLVVNQGNVVERRGIRSGIRVEQYRVIEEGIAVDDRVVVRGILKAVPGRQVTPVRQNQGAKGGA